MLDVFPGSRKAESRPAMLTHWTSTPEWLLSLSEIWKQCIAQRTKYGATLQCCWYPSNKLEESLDK